MELQLNYLSLVRRLRVRIPTMANLTDLSMKEANSCACLKYTPLSPASIVYLTLPLKHSSLNNQQMSVYFSLGDSVLLL